MDCACIYVDVDDYVTSLHEKTTKARKSHKCDECGKRIRKHSYYLNEAYIFESSFMVHKTCSICKSIRDVFFCSGFYYGMLWELLGNHLADIGIDDACFGKDILDLTPAAKNKLLLFMDEIKQGNSHQNKNSI